MRKYIVSRTQPNASSVLLLKKKKKHPYICDSNKFMKTRDQILGQIN